ncbi:hypothetical protein [Streptomyces tubercidicus]
MGTSIARAHAHPGHSYPAGVRANSVKRASTTKNVNTKAAPTG